MGVLSNAYQTSRIEELVKQGFAIIDQSEQFGGGNLQRHYGIKSNTSATGFLKVLMHPKVNQPGVPMDLNKQSQTHLSKNKSKGEVLTQSHKGQKIMDKEAHKTFLP